METSQKLWVQNGPTQTREKEDKLQLRDISRGGSKMEVPKHVKRKINFGKS